jgi:hypothetical protein
MRRVALDLAVFTGILVVGLTRLPEPFFGDQTVNMLMGHVIAGGGTPYADLWDPKYPGIFFVFAAAGTLFGFNEVGVHLFELLWMLALALVARLLSAHYLRRRSVVSLTPALTVGVYYAGTTSYHLTQPEAVIGLPLLLSLGAAVVAVRPSCRRPLVWLFASGLSAGVVFLFHAPYVALPASFWLFAGTEWRRRGEPIMRVIRRMAPPLVGGVLLPISIATTYLALTPGLGLVWWTLVVYPREAVSQCPDSLQRMIDGAIWFVRIFRVLLALAVVGAWDRLRRGWDLLTTALVAWVAGGVLLIWIQPFSGWSHQFLLLFVPIGLLGAQGVESLWRAATATATSRRLRAIAVTALLASGALFVRQLRPIAHEIARAFGTRCLPFDCASLSAYQAARYPSYANDLAIVSFLRDPHSHAGPIYVFAVPNLYHVARRPPAIPLLAAWFRPTMELWDRLMTELEKAAPPYILVNDHELRFVIAQNPALEEKVSLLRSRLEQRYQPLRTGVGGTWYLRRDLAVTATQNSD